MLLGLEAEGVNVDSHGGNVLVVLVGLHQVEVASIALGEPVVTVELELGSLDGVAAVLEGDGDEDVDGTTSGNTGHGTSIAVRGGRGGVDQVGVGSRECSRLSLGTRGGVGGVISISVVEPLLALGSRVGDNVVALHDPNELLARVIEVELNLVG